MNINIEHNVQMCMVHSEGGVYHVNILANAKLLAIAACLQPNIIMIMSIKITSHHRYTAIVQIGRISQVFRVQTVLSISC